MPMLFRCSALFCAVCGGLLAQASYSEECRGDAGTSLFQTYAVRPANASLRGASWASRFSDGPSEATAVAQELHQPSTESLLEEMEDLYADVALPPSLVAGAQARTAARADVALGLSAGGTGSRFIFTSHHKTGTMLMRSLAVAFAATFSLTTTIEWEDNLTRLQPYQLVGCNIGQVVALSNLDAAQLHAILRDCDFRAIHFVRDPVNVVISGYAYHSWSEDTWHMDTGPDILAGLSEQDGLRREASAESAGTLAEMKDVERIIGGDARFLDVQLESLEATYDETMREIGMHLLDNSHDADKFVAAARSFDISRWPKQRRRSEKHIASGATKEDLHGIFDKLVETEDPVALRVSELGHELGFQVP